LSACSAGFFDAGCFSTLRTIDTLDSRHVGKKGRLSCQTASRFDAQGQAQPAPIVMPPSQRVAAAAHSKYSTHPPQLASRGCPIF
jgi:hypothetical protein